MSNHLPITNSAPIEATSPDYYREHAVWWVEHRDLGSALLVGYQDVTLASDEERGPYPATDVDQLRVDALRALVDSDWWMAIRRGKANYPLRGDVYEFVGLGTDWAGAYRTQVLDFEKTSQGTLPDGVFLYVAPQEPSHEVLDRATRSLKAFSGVMFPLKRRPVPPPTLSDLADGALRDLPILGMDLEGDVVLLMKDLDWATVKARLDVVAREHGLVLPPHDRIVC